MKTSNLRVLALSAASLAAVGLASPASAGTGCNGIVNWFVWGCAGWDNNKGPKFPYYKVNKIEIPRANASVFNDRGAAFVKDTRTGKVYPIISGGGGNIVAGGAGNIVAGGAGNIVGAISGN